MAYPSAGAPRSDGEPQEFGRGGRGGRGSHPLDEHGDEGGLVLEQDTAITADEPTVGSGPVLDRRPSVAFLHNSARRTQEVNE